FVKTLLGRLVFLTFLQKKGWLGCPAGTRVWKNGQENFLQSFLKLATENQEADLFHSKYLTALFFEALNLEDREGDLFALTGTRLPYLNGGLFEDDDDHARSIDFPSQLFTDLLNFFDEYNFTIDENDPEDHEVGIDPEMLGMIFENLLEDNKEKGTYYTPKAIVSYMARQSLLHYLQTHLGENEALETLLNEKNSEALPSFIEANKARIIDLLEKVTICDPAIGSGAFPIGLLHEILWTRLTLEDSEKNTSKFRAELKRAIIQNSIHGVDLDPGAIEIARLRFWLALVVDEDKPRPLPNLDYKIHRADSLIEYIRGEAVNLGTETPDDATTKAAVAVLIKAKQDLFTAQGLPGKRKAWFALYRALSQLAQAEFTWMRNETDFTDGAKMALLNTGIKDFGQWIQKIDGIQSQKAYHQATLLEELRQWFDDEKHPTFLWNLHFGGIFANGGFDIVIANPPYGVGTLNRPSAIALREKFKTGSLITDPYPYFIRLAFDLGKKGSTTALINSNTWLLLKNTKFLRSHIQTKVAWHEIAILPPDVFDAVVDTHILLFKNSPPIAQPLQITEFTGSRFVERQTRERSTLPSDGNTLNISYSNKEVKVAQKLLSHPPLATTYSVHVGIKPFQVGKGQPHQTRAIVNDKPFVFQGDKPKIDGNWQPLLRGSLIERYRLRWAGDYWVNYGPWLAEPRTPEIFNTPHKIFVRQTGDSIVAAFSTDGYIARNNLHVVIPRDLET
ncbi:hypothetical protein N9027_01030, partial [bacterium]|nr:hypothetical protein [bacterium]